MKLLKKMALTAALASVFTVTADIVTTDTVTVEAAAVDAYRDMLMNHTYKIRYENITPPPRVTNRDKAPLYGKNGISTQTNTLLQNRSRTGLVTESADAKYEEVEGVGAKGILYTCHLQKNMEDFFFTKWQEKDEWKYVGSVSEKKGGVKKGVIEAQKANVMGEMVNGESYGEEDLTRLLVAILPDGRKSAAMPHYSPAGSGRLDDGTTYEDFSAEAEGGLSVIRYYFSQGSMVKIAEGSYYKNEDGTYSGRRCIIKINEFSSKPDYDLLRLPDGLKDKTKRNEKGEIVS